MAIPPYAQSCPSCWDTGKVEAIGRTWYEATRVVLCPTCSGKGGR